MAARNHSSVAGEMVLQSSVNSSATTFVVDTTTGLPASPFTVIIDPGESVEEVCTCTGVAGSNLTVVRGQDGTAASAHGSGAKVRHGVSARDFQEPNAHVNASAAVHGLSGSVVGTTDVQTLDGKTFLSADATGAPLTVQAQSGQSDAILAIKSSGGSTVASVVPSGRLATPGIDGSSSSTFTAGSAATVPAIVKGAGSQSAKLLSLRNNSDVELAGVSAAGVLVGSGADIDGVSILAPDATGNIALSLQNITSQTADIFRHLAVGGGVLVKIEVDGKLTCASLASGETFLTAPDAATVGLTIKNFVGQSANIFEHQNSSGAVVLSIAGNGRITTTRVIETDPPAYASYSPSIIGRTSGGGLNNGTTDAWYDQWRKQIHAYGSLTRGSTTAFGTGGVAMDLPVDHAHFAARRMIGTGLAFDLSTLDRIPLVIALDNSERLLWMTTAGAVVDPNVPFTWATGDELHWDITYEAA